MAWFNWPMFILVAVLCQVVEIARSARLDPAGYTPGDGGAYAAAVRSLWRDGDLDLLNQICPGKNSIADAAAELEGDLGAQFALTADGQMTLKHSPVMPVLTVPFYAVFGDPGFILCNAVATTGLLAALAFLAGGSPVARLVVLLGYLSGPLIMYAFDFSSNLFSTALLAGAMVAVRTGWYTAGGLLAGLAVGGRVEFAPLVVPVAALVAWEGGWRKAVGFGVGAVLALAPVLATNYHLFWHPLINGYERQLKIGPGGSVGISTHSGQFVPLSLSGVENLLMNPDIGIVWTAPLWVLWPAAAVFLAVCPYRLAGGRPWVAVTVAVIVLNLAFFACYKQWNASARGNRFLFPAEVMGYVLIAVTAAAASDYRRTKAAL